MLEPDTELRLIVANALQELLDAERDFTDGDTQAPGIAQRLLADIDRLAAAPLRDRLEEAEAERDSWQAKAELCMALAKAARDYDMAAEETT